MIYTSSELLKLAGLKPEEVLGKVGVTIGGLNVNKPNHLINVKSPKIKITAGEKSYDVEVPERETESEEVQAVRAEHAKIANKQTEEIQAKKKAEAEAKEKKEKPE